MKAYTTLFIILLLCLFVACNSSSNNNGDADADPDLDFSESELDAVDGDTADSDITDGNASDGDFDSTDNKLADGDSLETDIYDVDIENDTADVETEIEVEAVVYPPTIIETLPYDELTVTACEEAKFDDDLPPTSETNRLVWGDDDGLMYFADRNYYSSKKLGLKSSSSIFWVFDEVNKTISCEAEIDQPAFAMNGINTEFGTVIWLTQKNRLAKRKPTGEWLFFDIAPTSQQKQSDYHK